MKDYIASADFDDEKIVLKEADAGQSHRYEIWIIGEKTGERRIKTTISYGAAAIFYGQAISKRERSEK